MFLSCMRNKLKVLPNLLAKKVLPFFGIILISLVLFLIFYNKFIVEYDAIKNTIEKRVDNVNVVFQEINMQHDHSLIRQLLHFLNAKNIQHYTVQDIVSNDIVFSSHRTDNMNECDINKTLTNNGVHFFRICTKLNSRNIFYNTIIDGLPFISLIATMLMIAFLFMKVNDLRKKRAREAVFQILKSSEKLRNTNIKEIIGKISSKNLRETVIKFKKIVLEFEKSQLLISKKTTEEALGRLSAQVAHDIRSPLAALNVVLKDISEEVSDEERNLIRSSTKRINDIANDLLLKRKKSKEHSLCNKSFENNETILLSSLIEEIVSEKRIQVRSKMEIGIETAYSDNSFSLFTKAQPSVLKRILSNVINNSIEAFEKEQGDVLISTKQIEDSLIEIKIRVNGKGIPKSILHRIGNEELSHGKNNRQNCGNGLGLYYAKEAIEGLGGDLRILSQEHVGTEIIIRLPLMTAPEWFTQQLIIKENMIIVTVDDDQSIHQIWNKKITEYTKSNIKLKHFSTPEKFSRWYQGKENVSMIILVDYEFIGSKINGLDLIKNLNISQKAKLVSSRAEEFKIKSECNKLNVGLIPKTFVPYIPIKFDKGQVKKIILIDDDQLMHVVWKNKASKMSVNLTTYFAHTDFLKNAESHRKTDMLFIDSELADGIKGELVAKSIYDMGFKNISLTTGYEKSHFPSEMNWIKNITGKEFPVEYIQ